MYWVVDSFVLGIRALGIVAVFQAVGGYVFLRLFEREIAASEATLRALVRWSALAAVLLAVLYYFLVRVRMAGSFTGISNPVLADIVASSSVHPAQVFAVVGPAVLAVTVDIKSAFHRTLCLIGAGVGIFSFALTGHTTIHDLRPLLALLLIGHVAVAAAWFGALWPLRIVCAKEAPAVYAAIVQRFSSYAVRAVPVLFVCGLLMAVIFVSSIDQALTAYGLMLGLKLAGFAGVLAIANYNRSLLVPAIAGGDARRVATFRRVLIGEMVVLALIVFVTVSMTGFFAPEGLHGSFGEDH